MGTSTCESQKKTANQLRLTKDEFVALFMNMILFDGDWEAHTEFLLNLEESRDWKYDELFRIKDLQRLDLAYKIQDQIS